MAADGLSDKQRLFVEEYLVDLNATQAATRAGYSPRTAEQQGSRLLRNAQVEAAVKAKVEARAERLGLSQDDVVRGLASIAFGDLRNVVEWGRESDGEGAERLFVRLRASRELSDEVARMLSEVKVDAHGQLTVRTPDKIRALELLGKHLGMFSDKLDVNVSGGLHFVLSPGGERRDEPQPQLEE